MELTGVSSLLMTFPVTKWLTLWTLVILVYVHTHYRWNSFGSTIVFIPLMIHLATQLSAIAYYVMVAWSTLALYNSKNSLVLMLDGTSIEHPHVKVLPFLQSPCGKVLPNLLKVHESVTGSPASISLKPHHQKIIEIMIAVLTTVRIYCQMIKMVPKTKHNNERKVLRVMFCQRTVITKVRIYCQMTQMFPIINHNKKFRKVTT